MNDLTTVETPKRGFFSWLFNRDRQPEPIDPFVALLMEQTASGALQWECRGSFYRTVAGQHYITVNLEYDRGLLEVDSRPICRSTKLIDVIDAAQKASVAVAITGDK